MFVAETMTNNDIGIIILFASASIMILDGFIAFLVCDKFKEVLTELRKMNRKD